MKMKKTEKNEENPKREGTKENIQNHFNTSDYL